MSKKRRYKRIMSWHPLQKKGMPGSQMSDPFSALSLISFLPLIYSKEALWLHHFLYSCQLHLERRTDGATPRQPSLLHSLCGLFMGMCVFVCVCVPYARPAHTVLYVFISMHNEGLCSSRDGPIINYSLPGNTLVLTSNNKISRRERQTQRQKNICLLHFWGSKSAHIREQWWIYMPLPTIMRRNVPWQRCWVIMFSNHITPLFIFEPLSGQTDDSTTVSACLHRDKFKKVNFKSSSCTKLE